MSKKTPPLFWLHLRLKSRKRIVRVHAAKTLGKLQSQKSVEPLLKALKKERYHWPLQEIIKALTQLRVERDEDITILVEQFQYACDKIFELNRIDYGWGSVPGGHYDEEHDMMEIITNVSKIMARLRNDNVIKFLTIMLSHSEYQVRQAVVRALGELGEVLAYELLVKAQQDERREVRVEVVRVLGDMKEQKSLKLLKEALNEKEKYTKLDMLEALSDINNPVSIELLEEAAEDKDRDVRERAKRYLRYIK